MPTFSAILFILYFYSSANRWHLFNFKNLILNKIRQMIFTDLEETGLTGVYYTLTINSGGMPR